MKRLLTILLGRDGFRSGGKVNPMDTQEKLYIPKEDVREVLSLYDTYRRDGTMVSHYNLWTRLIEIFPQIERGHWVLIVETSPRPYVYRKA